MDYLIGISIFLISVIFVFSYTVGLFTPFQSNSDEVTLIADKISTNVVEQTLSAQQPGTTNLLNGTKVENFFTEFNTDYQGIVNHLGLNGTYLRHDLNITLENNTATIYSSGKVLPSTGNIGQTKRIVLLRDENTGDTSLATLSLRVW
ncbi:hypothetical protein V7O66_11700 [Methanolobus sp. ZRKC3]|uniref:DUF7287 family protein n=1 Tax=Methanolobus sp. ZRKC3 TaxID=3125786 RepID=UPI0032479771